MTVDRRRPDRDDIINVCPGTNKAAIVKLYKNTNLACTPAEIQNLFDLRRGTTPTTLSQLHDDGFIRKTSDGLSHGLGWRDDMKRFAWSLVQLNDMMDRYSEPELAPDILSKLAQAYEEKSHAIALAPKRTGPERNQHQRTGSTALSLPHQWIINR